MNSTDFQSLRQEAAAAYLNHGDLAGLEARLGLSLSREQLPLLFATDAEHTRLKLGPTGLAHEQLAGHAVWSEADALALDEAQFDLARALLITQFGADREAISAYETHMDLMALDIRSRLHGDLSDTETVIEAINYYPLL